MKNQRAARCTFRPLIRRFMLLSFLWFHTKYPPLPLTSLSSFVLPLFLSYFFILYTSYFSSILPYHRFAIPSLELLCVVVGFTIYGGIKYKLKEPLGISFVMSHEPSVFCC